MRLVLCMVFSGLPEGDCRGYLPLIVKCNACDFIVKINVIFYSIGKINMILDEEEKTHYISRKRKKTHYISRWEEEEGEEEEVRIKVMRTRVYRRQLPRINLIKYRSAQ